MRKIRIASDYTGIGSYNHSLKRCNVDYEEVFACDFNLYARISFLSTFGTKEDLKLANSKEHRIYAREVEKICTGVSDLSEIEQTNMLEMANDYAKKFSFYYPFNVYDREIPEDPLDEYMTSPPCQAFSLAGKREGKESLKGILFFNSHEFIDKNRPRFFRFENVKGLLSDDGGRTFQEWINMLGGKSVNGVPVLFPDENSVPYHIYWKVLNAKDFNIPQNRERVFIVGIRDDEDNVFQWPRETVLDRKLKDVLEDQVDTKYFLSDEMVQRLNDQRDNKSNNFSVKDVTGMDVAPTVISGGTSSKDKQHVIKVIGNTNPSGNGMNGNVFDSNGISPTLSTNKGEGIKVKVSSNKVIQLNPSKESGGNQPYKHNRVYDSNGVSPTLDTECGRPGYLVDLRIGTWRTHNNGQGFREMQDGLCPTIPARAREDGSGQPVILQRGHGFVQDSVHELSPTITGKSWKDNNHIAIPKNKDYQVPLEGETSDEYWGRMTEYEKEHPIPESEKLCIPVLTPDRIEKRQNGRRFKEDGDPSFTITTQDRHGIYDGYSIRRLTPLECWRLMDFPDESLHNAVDAGMKDSQLYKQAGNSIPVGMLVGVTKGLKKLIS